MNLDSLRYILALLSLVTIPPALLHWYLLHPFVRIWRRLGVGISYAVFLSVMAAGGVGLFLVRDTLLAVEYGTRPVLIGAGVLLYIAAILIQSRIRKQLTFRILTGVPELAPEGEARGELLTDGLYGRVRHPRYLAVALGTIGWALIANYLAIYAVAAVTVVGLVGIVRLEERELRERFGDAHAAYCRRVPMLIPRLGPVRTSG